MLLKIISIFLFLSIFLHAEEAKPYGAFGVYRSEGLTAGMGYGFMSHPKCDGFLFQWSGAAAYQYHPDWTGIGLVNVRGGQLDSNRSLSLTQYWMGLQRNFVFKDAFLGIRIEGGLDNSALSSSVPDETPEDVCPEFIQENGSGITLAGYFSHRLGYEFWLTGHGKYGYSYNGRLFNESSLGLAYHLTPLFSKSKEAKTEAFAYSDLMLIYVRQKVRLSMRFGFSFLF